MNQYQQSGRRSAEIISMKWNKNFLSVFLSSFFFWWKENKRREDITIATSSEKKVEDR